MLLDFKIFQNEIIKQRKQDKKNHGRVPLKSGSADFFFFFSLKLQIYSSFFSIYRYIVHFSQHGVFHKLYPNSEEILVGNVEKSIINILYYNNNRSIAILGEYFKSY